ncbi:hypothetical protein [uncultured Paracoccus sp.]|uniref:hypothetical protein n=1 Tax=uncultured Paracoccus sp. TaxID=189685 RepID=UPI0025EDFF58|nr:hypothetical protein [uncultured Paracoccus sp.]
MKFEDHGVSAGCWTGALQADRQPGPVSVVHRGVAVAQARLRDAGPGVWAVAADLPGTVIDRGAHGLLLVAGEPGAAGSRVLARLMLVAGQVAGDDLLAEVAHLRAELDLLKREFRRLAAGS